MTRIPKRLQPILWSADIKDIDLKRDAPLVTHRVLALGELADITWLLKTYGREKVRRIFLEQPQPIYTLAALNFVKNFILDLGKAPFNPKKYVKTVY